MLRIIREHPVFKDRFDDAEMIGEIKGWGLPLGSESRDISGDKLMLTGDAASLIDPFTGEGIGNAMLSGMKAGQQAKRCIEATCVDGEFLKQYDRDVYRVVGSELKLSNRLQKLSQSGWLMNLFFNRACRSKALQEYLPLIFYNPDEHKVLKDMRFFLKLVFKY
jgi:flavin-dependent dehydrogenase